MSVTTVVLLDDHKILREGVRHLLEDEPDFQVVGEAEDGSQGIEVTVKLRPDLLISDLMMTGLTGIDVTREVRKRSPATRIIILSMYDDPGFVEHAMREGAKAYVLKGSGINELLSAMREVLAGGTYVSPSIRH